MARVPPFEQFLESYTVTTRRGIDSRRRTLRPQLYQPGDALRMLLGKVVHLGAPSLALGPTKHCTSIRWALHSRAESLEYVVMEAADIKPRPNHQRYLEILRAMTPEERLRKAWELTETTRMLFRAGLRHRFPQMPEEDLQRLYVRELHKCRNNGC